jgi:hypothetical protein
MTAKEVKKQIRKALNKDIYKAYGIDSLIIYTIISPTQIEVHTDGWRAKLEAIGYTWVKQGYFSDIYTMPSK